MSRNYERLPIEQFGRHLLESGDLDPVYIALHKMELPSGQLARWLMAYWCLYHAGAASWLSEQKGDEFWTQLYLAAKNELPAPTGDRWPRGHERRHWRGEQACASAKFLRELGGSPKDLIDELSRQNTPTMYEDGSIPFTDISNRVQKWQGFGPWISFKVGDMLDRLGLCKVNFDAAEVFMFKDPKEAAFKLWRMKMGLADNVKPKDETWLLGEIVSGLTHEFREFTAPPLHDRPVGLQEVETILCKWKSHMNGHYPLNNDIMEISEGLKPWCAVSETASAFWHAMPDELLEKAA